MTGKDLTPSLKPITALTVPSTRKALLASLTWKFRKSKVRVSGLYRVRLPPSAVAAPVRCAGTVTPPAAQSSSSQPLPLWLVPRPRRGYNFDRLRPCCAHPFPLNPRKLMRRHCRDAPNVAPPRTGGRSHLQTLRSLHSSYVVIPFTPLPTLKRSAKVCVRPPNDNLNERSLVPRVLRCRSRVASPPCLRLRYTRRAIRPKTLLTPSRKLHVNCPVCADSASKQRNPIGIASEFFIS